MMIRTKIWFSIIAVLLLLVVVAFVSQNSIKSTSSQLDNIINKEQPKLIYSMALAEQLYQSTSALGNYARNPNDHDRDIYHQKLSQAQESIKALKQLKAYQVQPSFKECVDEVSILVKAISALNMQLFELANNQLKNIPALGLAKNQLEPVANMVFQVINDLLDSEENSDDEVRWELSQTMRNLRYTWVAMHSNVTSYLIYRDDQAKKAIFLYLNGVEQHFNQLQQQDMLSDDQMDHLDDFSDYRAEYQTILNQVIEMHSGEAWRQDNYLMRKKLSPLLLKLDIALEKMVLEGQATIKSTQATLKENLANTKLLVLIIMVVGVVSGVIILWIANQQVIRPIHRLRDILHDVAEGTGDLTQRINLQSNDELGEMSQYFNQVLQSQREMVIDIKSVTLAVNKEVEDSCCYLKEMISQMAESMETISQNTVQTIVIDDLSSTVATHAKETADVVGKSVSSADNAALVMNKMANNAIEVTGNIDQLQEFVISLTNTSQRLMTMIDVIRGITEQTNLLALNAAIESARAGEAGRGFSVVADEVRQLAFKTQELTSEIVEVLKENFDANQNLVVSIDETKKKTQLLQQNSESTQHEIKEISCDICNVSSMAQEIVGSVEQQQAAVELLRETGTKVSDMSANSVESINNIGLLMKNVEEKSQQLQQVVNRFIV